MTTACRRASLILFLNIALAVSASEPWEGEAFSSDPKVLLAAANAVKPQKDDEGVIVLLDEARYTFDKAGRARRVHRLVFRIDDEAVAEDWGTIEAPWSPWYEDRPSVDARVITASGSVHRLDPKSFGTADATDDTNIFSDTRVLRGPLPAVAKGSVIEQVITYHEKNPLADAGVSRRHSFGRWVGTERARLVIEHPASLQLHVSNRTKPGIELKKSMANGLVTLTLEAQRLPANKAYEWNVPSDASERSYVAFSTGKSWQDVARRYSEIVDRQIAAGPVHPPAARKPDESKRQTATRLLDAISRQIRYAGVEFGEGSIVPRSPADTLEHKYGDCKDKATLLIAMLRQAGIPAHAVLLVSGNGQDVDPDLPGMGHFDHVIVHVPGDDPFWIDPTDEFARAGELPDQDQDRQALIAAPGTTTLVRTPASDSSANRTIETREFLLAEDGRAMAIESTEYHGSQERAMRRHYVETEARTIREQLETYVKQTYLAEALGKYETGDPRDLSIPFRVRIEALRVMRGLTSGGEAAVAVASNSLLADMPWTMLKTPDEDEDEEAKEKNRRVADFVFTSPHIIEVRYKITPPPGYVPRELREKETVKVGTATLTREYSQAADGNVLAVHRFDSGPRRITAAQFEENRIRLKELQEDPLFLLYFDQVGAQMLAAGNVGEAIKEFRRMVALHPGEALHRGDVARALLAGGLGSAARREAKRATEVEPKSARAHHTVGNVLAHDLIGRQFGPGFDLAGSVAAYRKAKQIDPKDINIRAELAVVLQRNQEGTWYGKGADLKSAIDEYLELKKIEGIDQLAIERELMVLYVRSGRFQELKKLTETTKDTEKRDAFSVVAAAALNGPAAGVRASEAIELSRRRLTQVTAGQVLAIIRMYPEAAALLKTAASGAPNAAELRVQADLMGKIKRVEEIPSTSNDPRDTLRRFLSVAFQNANKAELNKLIQSESAIVFENQTLGEDAGSLAASGKAVRRMARKEGMVEFMADAGTAALQIQQDGSDETGYRLLARAPGMQQELGMFIVREKNEYRLAAMNVAPAMLGLQALRLAQAGKGPIARQWLDWAREYVRPGAGDDPLTSSPFGAFWTRGQEATDEQIMLAAALLLPDTKRSAEIALPILIARRDTLPEGERWRIDQALFSAYRATERWEEGLATADRLLVKHPTSASAFRWATGMLMKLSRSAEITKRSEARLAQLPGNKDAMRILGEMAFRAGDYAKGREYYGKLLQGTDIQASDYNQHSWMAMMQPGANLEQAIEEARQGVALAPQAGSIMHTLAALYAETGKSAEARDALLKSMELANNDEPKSHDWYVLGRIAENYGINEEAIEAYRRVTKPDDYEAGSTWFLAQRRLKILTK